MAQSIGCNGNCADCAGKSGCSSTGQNNCNACGGCGNTTLFLTGGEIELLRRFAQIPFWPLCRRAGSDTPVCLEEGGMAPELLQSLSLKGLIRFDYDLPLTNFDYHAYTDCSHRGSMALTAAGQRAAEVLEIRGIDADELSAR